MTRATYLLQSDLALLNAWADELGRVFDEHPYLVGSALERADYRDVDVRIMLDDQHYDDLIKVIEVGALNLALSLWGQKATGLPIECQVQHTTSANEDFHGRRHPLATPQRLARLRAREASNV